MRAKAVNGIKLFVGPTVGSQKPLPAGTSLAIVMVTGTERAVPPRLSVALAVITQVPGFQQHLVIA